MLNYFKFLASKFRQYLKQKTTLKKPNALIQLPPATRPYLDLEGQLAVLVSRRLFLLGISKATLLTLIALRITYLQVTKYKIYQVLSDKNRIAILVLVPQRGRILDRYGQLLANNKSSLRVLINKYQYLARYKATNTLEDILKVNKASLENKLNQVSINDEIVILDDIPWEQMVLIEENLFQLKGVYIDDGYYRVYHFKDLMAHIVGYVGIANKKEQKELGIKKPNNLYVGKSGIEKYYQFDLQGTFGSIYTEVNSSGLYKKELARVASRAGQDIALSIDADLQAQTLTLLKHLPKFGAAVILDIKEGRPLAMCSIPSFDPNKFIKGISQQEWQRIQADNSLPLMDRVIQGQYPPGSVFKIVTILAALQAGISSDLRISCHGQAFLGNHFHCWHRHGHGAITMIEAIRRSCNIYIYQLAKLIGAKNIITMARHLGLGQLTEIDLPGENSGFIPDEKWKKRKLQAAWSLGDTLNLAIGQGFITATPLQLACLTGAIANGGKLYSPRLNLAHAVGYRDLKLKEEILAPLKQGLLEAVNHPTGTAYAIRVHNPKMLIAGKSGTAQNKNKGDHALFTAYGPVSDPKYAVAVVVEHGGWGSKAAAPIAQKLLLAAMERDKL